MESNRGARRASVSSIESYTEEDAHKIAIKANGKELSVSQTILFKQEAARYKNSARTQKHKQLFFKEVKKLPEATILFALEEHGLRKHFGGQNSGTKWKFSKNVDAMTLNAAVEKYMEKHFKDSLLEKCFGLQSNMCFDIGGFLSELELKKLPDQWVDTTKVNKFKIQLVVEPNNDALIIYHHHYPVLYCEMGLKFVPTAKTQSNVANNEQTPDV